MQFTDHDVLLLSRCAACSFCLTIEHLCDAELAHGHVHEQADAGFYVANIVKPHLDTCIAIPADDRARGHKRQNVARAHMVPMVVEPFRQAPLTYTVTAARETLRAKLFADPGLDAAFAAWQQAQDLICGHRVCSYWYLESWVARMKNPVYGGDAANHTAVGTRVIMERDARGRSTGQRLDGTHAYDHVMCVPAAARRAWPHMRPLIVLDACHCTHVHAGNLFIAVGLDPNGGTLILGFGHAGNESTESWRQMVVALKTALSLNDRPDLAIMSARDKGLKAVLRDELPGAAHLHCTVHIARNVTDMFGKNDRQYEIAFHRLAKALTQQQYDEQLARLKEVQPHGDEVAAYVCFGTVPERLQRRFRGRADASHEVCARMWKMCLRFSLTDTH